jgi:hypothetical protein
MTPPAPTICGSCSTTSPGATTANGNELIERILDDPLRFRADTLAWRLGLTEAERTLWGIRTIGSIDMTKAQRKLARKLADRERKRAQRRARKVTPRAEYLEANSLSRTKPWIAAGVSRRTWERRRGRSFIKRGTDDRRANCAAARAIHRCFANRSGKARQFDKLPAILREQYRAEARAALTAAQIASNPPIPATA